MSNESEHVDVKLKHRRHLDNYHTDEIKELNEDRTTLVILEIFAVMTHASFEHMTEAQPIFLY